MQPSIRPPLHGCTSNVRGTIAMAALSLAITIARRLRSRAAMIQLSEKERNVSPISSELPENNAQNTSVLKQL